jgi:alanyl-tRNA synthetase
MNSTELRKKYLKFFEEKGHAVIPSASLVPANDPTVLFTTAGMHPLVPYLLGEKHPDGTRLVDVQKCLRTDDIDEVGDETHLTFFEMLGNWSLGDYWKKDSIQWSYEFLTDPNWLGLDKSRLAVTVFTGDNDAPRDEESAEIWQSLGFSEDRIAYLGKKDNWWGPPGATGPCGPDTEIFYWTGELPAPVKFDGEDKRWVEIWNNVFMQYEKNTDGKFVPLKQQNVDTGMGMERVTAILEGKPSIYETELFVPILDKIATLVKTPDEKSMRIIADHMRAAVFLVSDGVIPSNKDRGYILRRLIRRSVTHGQKMGIEKDFTSELTDVVVQIYKQAHPDLDAGKIGEEIKKEELKFRATLAKGMKLLEKKEGITGKEAFDLFQTYGFPFELTKEFAVVANISEFEEEFKKHQGLSRTASAGMFKGGLANQNEKTIRLHTAHHLLLAALQNIVDKNIKQRGSNITEERLRIDFLCDHKLTDEEKKKVEDWVNDKINQKLNVVRREMPLAEAEKLGAEMEFGAKYPEVVSVYFIEDANGNAISKEFCGGPHVKNTGELGHFKIQKEEAVSAGVRRIKAIIH